MERQRMFCVVTQTAGAKNVRKEVKVECQPWLVMKPARESARNGIRSGIRMMNGIMAWRLFGETPPDCLSIARRMSCRVTARDRHVQSAMQGTSLNEIKVFPRRVSSECFP